MSNCNYTACLYLFRNFWVNSICSLENQVAMESILLLNWRFKCIIIIPAEAAQILVSNCFFIVLVLMFCRPVASTGFFIIQIHTQFLLPFGPFWDDKFDMTKKLMDLDQVKLCSWHNYCIYITRLIDRLYFSFDA